jgi:microcin C transport system ATP-binding protein
MKLGKLVERGSAEQIFNNPKDPYTKSLIAAAFDLKSLTGTREEDEPGL